MTTTSWNKIWSKLNKITMLVVDLMWAIRGHRSAWFLLFSAHRLAEFDTSVICHVLMHCLGSFLLDDMFLSLQAFTCTRQNRNFLENGVVAYFYNLYVMSGLAIWLKLFASTVCRLLSWIWYLFSNIFLWRYHRGLVQTSLMVCTLVTDVKCLFSLPASCI